MMNAGQRFSDSEWRRIFKAGGLVSLAPPVVMFGIAA